MGSEDMKIRIEVDKEIQEDQVIIRCKQLNDDVSNIQKALTDILSKKAQIIFYKNNSEYYIPLSEILFFETEESSISAHTIDNIYQVKYKL